MKLNNILNFPIGYLHMERFVDKRQYSPFCEYSEVDEKYRPTSDNSSFDLPCFLVPKDKCDIFLANPSESLIEVYDLDNVPFRLHPELLTGYSEESTELKKYKQGKIISVVPTSSTRTVFCLDSPNHFIKLHLPKRISRFNRRLRANSIEHSIRVSGDLENLAFEGFSYLPESIGISYRSGSGFGFLIREIKPRPNRQDRFLIPYFALYSPDTRNPQDKPLLVQMIELREENPTQFILEKVLIPLIRSWGTILNERGILLESHGQNTLLEVDSELNPRRVTHRDFQSSMIDISIREYKKLDNPFKKHLIEVEGYFSREQEYSLVYDYFIGHHLFNYLVEMLPRFYKIDIKEIVERCKNEFNRVLDEPVLSSFPNTTFRFVEEPFPDNIPKLEDTNQKPKWR